MLDRSLQPLGVFYWKKWTDERYIFSIILTFVFEKNDKKREFKLNKVLAYVAFQALKYSLPFTYYCCSKL